MISVIVPIYKVEKYLRRCIDSILGQTYSDLEVILVDDGSPDGCPEICDEYEKKDPRVKVIHQKNGGLSAARNVGLDICIGEHITFVDSDDWLHPQMLERLLDAINSAPDVGVSVCGYCETSQEESVSNVESNGPTELLAGEKAVEAIMGPDNVMLVTAWGKLYQRELFTGIRYPVGRIHEDEFVTYKLYILSKNVAIVREKLYFYFQREDSIMATPSLKARMDGLDALIERVTYCSQNGMKEFSRKVYFDIEFWVSRKLKQGLDDTAKKQYQRAYWKLLKVGFGVLPFKLWLISMYQAIKLCTFEDFGK